MKTSLCAAIVAIATIAWPAASLAGAAPDSDGDGVNDPFDNCLFVPNGAPANCDIDMDGYGNLCDCDLAPGSSIGCDFGADFAVFLSDFASSAAGTGGPAYVSDLNCDGSVDFGQDFPIFLRCFAATAAGDIGPGSTSGCFWSALACAGTMPCP